MEIDWNVLSKQWSDSNFRIGVVMKFIKKPGELFTSYRTIKPSFTIIKQGQGVLLLDTHTYGLQPRTIVHSCSDMWLKAWNTGDEFFECYRVLYETSLMGNPHMQETYKHYQVTIGDSPQIYTILEQMCEFSSQGDIQSELQVKTLFYHFLNETRISSKKLQVNEHRVMIEETMTYIHLHIQEPHSLFSLASRYEISPKYFAELFYKVAGVSPINYIIRYRINTAEKMLLSTNASIREIGKSVGYSDPYQFSKIFKKYKGVAPSDLKSGHGIVGKRM